METIKFCPYCGSELKEMPGIGPACLGIMTCPVHDGAIWWVMLSEEERNKEIVKRLEECRRYKAAGNPNFQDLDI